MHDAPPVLSIEGLSKTFPGQRALDDVAIEVHRGEVVALCGENGCGKSTLIKCLSGFHEPDEGSRILLGGRPLADTADGGGQGIAFIHQELGLVPTLSVVENLALGRGFATGPGGRIRWRTMEREARRLLEEFGHGEIRPTAILGRLTQAQQTVVAIVRGLQALGEGQGQLLVLDEPTAALPPSETATLFAAVRRVVARGTGVIFVSHRLDEVFELSDRVVVLRDGRSVGSFPTSELDHAKLIEQIVGEPLEEFYRAPVEPRDGADAVLRVDGLAGPGVTDATFEIAPGEIVGIAGLLGSGRSELLHLLFGANRRTAGRVELDGRPFDPQYPPDAIRAGVALVPEDRRADAAFAEMSLAENILITDLPRFFRAGRMRKRESSRRVNELVETFNVKPARPGKPFFQFSGGNQQKAIMARWLPLEPRLVLLDEPAQGVDVGAKAEIFAAVERSAASGSGVLMVSSDFEDLTHVCHRVLVMQDGRIVDDLDTAHLDRKRLMAAVQQRHDHKELPHASI